MGRGKTYRWFKKAISGSVPPKAEKAARDSIARATKTAAFALDIVGTPNTAVIQGSRCVFMYIYI